MPLRNRRSGGGERIEYTCGQRIAFAEFSGARGGEGGVSTGSGGVRARVELGGCGSAEVLSGKRGVVIEGVGVVRGHVASEWLVVKALVLFEGVEAAH
jgi:hypothetical protein